LIFCFQKPEYTGSVSTFNLNKVNMSKLKDSANAPGPDLISTHSSNELVSVTPSYIKAAAVTTAITKIQKAFVVILFLILLAVALCISYFLRKYLHISQSEILYGLAGINTILSVSVGFLKLGRIVDDKDKIPLVSLARLSLPQFFFCGGSAYLDYYELHCKPEEWIVLGLTYLVASYFWVAAFVHYQNHELKHLVASGPPTNQPNDKPALPPPNSGEINTTIVENGTPVKTKIQPRLLTVKKALGLVLFSCALTYVEMKYLSATTMFCGMAGINTISVSFIAICTLVKKMRKMEPDFQTPLASFVLLLVPQYFLCGGCIHLKYNESHRKQEERIVLGVTCLLAICFGIAAYAFYPKPELKPQKGKLSITEV
ncbi:hypothetical protein Ocin01_17259, partial [Orchesella cincta]